MSYATIHVQDRLERNKTNASQSQVRGWLTVEESRMTLSYRNFIRGSKQFIHLQKSRFGRFGYRTGYATGLWSVVVVMVVVRLAVVVMVRSESIK